MPDTFSPTVIQQTIPIADTTASERLLLSRIPNIKSRTYRLVDLSG